MNDQGHPFLPALPDVLKCDILGPRHAMAEHGEAWHQLAESVTDATIFMWPEVFAAWLDELATGVTPQLFMAFSGNRLVAVMPLMQAWVQRGPSFAPRIDYAPYDRDLAPGGFRPFRLRQISSVVSWRGMMIRPALLAAPANRIAAIQGLARCLSRLANVDQIVLPILTSERQIWREAFDRAGLSPITHELNRQVSTLERITSCAAHLAMQSANFRKNMRRSEAAAVREGLTFEFHVGRAAVVAQTEVIAALASASWKAGQSTAATAIVSYEGAQRRYVENLINRAGKGLTPIVCIGTLAGLPVLCIVMMRHGGTLTALLIFRRENASKFSIASLGFLSIIDWCSANDVKTLDLNATQDWVRNFTDTKYMIENITAFGKTPRGHLAASIRRVWSKMRQS